MELTHDEIDHCTQKRASVPTAQRLCYVSLTFTAFRLTAERSKNLVPYLVSLTEYSELFLSFSLNL